MNINNNDSQDMAITVAKIKKQSKKLLKLSKSSNDVLSISNLSQAQELLAQVYGYPSWHAIQQNLNNNQHSDLNFPIVHESTREKKTDFQKFIEKEKIFYQEENGEVVSYFQITHLSNSLEKLDTNISKLNKLLSFYLNMGIHQLSIFIQNVEEEVPSVINYNLIDGEQKILKNNALLKKLFGTGVNLENAIKQNKRSVLKIFLILKTNNNFFDSHKEVCLSILDKSQSDSLKLSMVDGFYVDELNNIKNFKESVIVHKIKEDLCQSLIWNTNYANLMSLCSKWVYLLNFIQKNKIEVKVNMDVCFGGNIQLEFANSNNDVFVQGFLNSIVKTSSFSSDSLNFRYSPLHKNKRVAQNSLNYPSVIDCDIYNHEVNSGEYNPMDVKFIVGNPGSGKSTIINNLLLSQSIKDNVEEIPPAFVIDIGGSYTSYLSILKNIYNQKSFDDSVLELKLDNHQYVNIFDTALGVRKYSDEHKTLIVNALLSLIPKEFYNSNNKTLESALYLMLENSRFSKHKKYEHNVDIDVSEALNKIGFNVLASTTWWGVVDELFLRGYYNEAIKAQRYAVHNLSDVFDLIRYNEKSEFTILLKAFEYYLENNFKTFHITNINIQDKKIVVCDLDKICYGKKSYSDYMGIALLNLANNYIIGSVENYRHKNGNMSDIELKYYEYHKNKFNNQKIKNVVIDELHRFNNPFLYTVGSIMRTSRQYNVSLFVSSQSVDSLDYYWNFTTELWLSAGISNKSIDSELLDFSTFDDIPYDNFCWKVSKVTPDGGIKNMIRINISHYLQIASSSLVLDKTIREELLKRYTFIEYLDKVKSYLDKNGVKYLYHMSNKLNDKFKTNEELVPYLLSEIESLK